MSAIVKKNSYSEAKFDTYLKTLNLDFLIEPYPIAEKIVDMPLTPYVLKNTNIIIFDINFSEKTVFQTNMLIAKLVNTIMSAASEKQIRKTGLRLPFNSLDYRKMLPLKFILKYLHPSIMLLEDEIKQNCPRVYDTKNFIKYFVEVLHKINPQKSNRVNLRTVNLFWEAKISADKTVELLESKAFENPIEELILEDIKRIVKLPTEWVSRIYE